MLLLFILTFIITAKATEDTKYIDLLPQKEKELLLDRVARRILEEVDSKPSKQKSGGEVPEEELDVHAEFVKKILREEEANLRKNNHNANVDLSVKPLEKDSKTIDLTIRSRTRRNNDKIIKRNFDADSDLENNDVKTQSINEPGSKSDEKDIQIKDFKIKSNDDPKVDPEANNDDVQTISTDKVTVEAETPTIEQQDNVGKVRTDESKSKTTTSKAEENKSSSQSHLSENINDKNQQGNKPIERNNKSTEKHDYNSHLNKTTFLDIPVQVLRDGDSVKNIKETSSKEGTAPKEEVAYTTTQKQVDNVETTEKEDTTTKTNVSELEAKEDIKRDINAVADTESNKEINDSRNEDESVKNFRINTMNFGESKINLSDTNNTNKNLFIDLESTTQSSVKVDSKTKRVDRSTKKHSKNNEIVSASSDNIKETLKFDIGNSKSKDDSVKPKVYRKKKIHQRDTENMKPLTKHKLEATTQKIEILTPLIPLTSKYNTRNSKNKIKHTKEVDSKIIQVLRDVIERTKVNANGRFEGLKSINKMKEYKVYEMPIPDKKNIIDDAINKEQPYYFPTYNYSPQNAYYNAHNNFGPNQDDVGVQNDKNLEQDIQGKGNYQTVYFFNDDNNKKVRFGNTDGSEHTKDILNFNPMVVKYPIKFNTDYDELLIGRKKHTKSKNKDENEEPKLKSSLREIRMMMYATKMFGYIPDKNYSSMEVDNSNSTETEVITEKSNLRVNFEAILKREKKERERRIIADESDIAVDYYFGRMNHDSKSNEVNKIKPRYTGIPIVKDVVQRILDKNNYKIYVIDPAYLKPRINGKYIARTEEKKQQPNIEKKQQTRFENIQQILNITNDVDMIPTLNKLLKMNITRSRAEERDLEIYVDVLADLIQTDNTALVQYDWLGTTVNIQGATLKLHELTQLVLFNKYINPSDLELLKYAIYLYKKASVINQYHEELRMKLPRGKRMKKKLITTNKGLTDRVWLYRQSADTDEKKYYKLTKNDVKLFGEFLDELLNSLYEIHTAIKEIASITNYNHQDWFQNLKDLYLKRTRLTTLELLLHLTANRVLDLIENSARHGLENDYIRYIKKNEKEVKRTENEFVFLVKILNEIEIMNE